MSWGSLCLLGLWHRETGWKSSQMTQAWLAGPVQGTEAKAGVMGVPALLPAAAPPQPPQSWRSLPHQEEKQNKHLQGVCLENTRFY